MKTSSQRVHARLRRDRPMTTISMRIPEDVVDDLKEIAKKLDFSGYQPLIRAYIGQGLRRDLARLDRPELAGIEESMRRHGVREETIAAILEDSAGRRA